MDTAIQHCALKKFCSAFESLENVELCGSRH